MFRPMVRKKQQISEEACIQVLKEQPRGVLSVWGDDDYPYGMPLDHWYCEEDGKLYFHSGKIGHKVDAMKRHDKVSYCVFDEGYRREGEWALNIQSVIVFGRIRVVEDPVEAMDIVRKLSYKYTSDTEYIEKEILQSGAHTLVFALEIEHMTGKLVHEA